MSDDDLFRNHPANARAEASDDAAEPEEAPGKVDHGDGEVPDEPVPSVPPEVPDDPVVPDEPVPAEVPDETVPAEVPDEPVPPEVPYQPARPEVPDQPVPPEVPDEPATREVPDDPMPPEVPDAPDTPEVPDDPMPPEVPVSPDAFDHPGDAPGEDADPSRVDLASEQLPLPMVPPADDADGPDGDDGSDEVDELDRDMTDADRPDPGVPDVLAADADDPETEDEPVEDEPIDTVAPAPDEPSRDDQVEPDDEPTWYDAVAQGLADPEPIVADDGDAPGVQEPDDVVEDDRDAHEPEGDVDHVDHVDDAGDIDDMGDGGADGTVDDDASDTSSTATLPDEDDLDAARDPDPDAAPGAAHGTATVVAPAPTRGAPGQVVVVTGGSGHIGSLVVDALVRDARVGQVVAVDRRAPSVPRPRVIEVTSDLDAVDLPDLFATHEVAVVVHLAAILDPPSDMDDDVLHDLEVGGTQRVVDAAVSAGVTHLTVASSGAAYGYHQSNRGRRLTEDDPLRGHPDHAYARHKAEVEQLLATARRLHPELGQLVLRLSTVLGPATANPVTRLFRAPVVLTLRDSPVPFSFVWDADVASVVTTGVVERRTGIYNVAGDGVVTMREVAELSGKRVLAVPSGWVERGLGLLARRDLAPFGPEQVDFLRHRPVLANDRLHRDFPGALTKSSREAFVAWVAQDR